MGELEITLSLQKMVEIIFPKIFFSVYLNLNYFALNIIGDSMIDIGINEGDIAIIKQKNDAKDGDLVVALIDETETTLKRFRKNGKEVVLEAENKNYKSQVYKSGSNIKIQGILSGLIRRYN